MQVQVAAKRRTEDNQSVIESLFSVILFCGIQGLDLRGHWEDEIEWEEDMPGNHGNFITLVCFRAQTDETLKKHLKMPPRNAKYTLKTIQNQLFDIIGKQIQKKFLDELKMVKIYSIIADEICDASNKEQFFLCLHYARALKVKRMFLDFVEVERITGRELARAIFHCLRTWGLPLSTQ